MVRLDWLVLLRMQYNVLILSSGFLFGVSVAGTWSLNSLFGYLCALVLMGGMNLYNSAYDRDTGPIGGLATPPSPPAHAAVIALMLQACIVGLLSLVSVRSAIVGLVACLLSILYSHPLTRWKRRIISSFVAIGIGNALLVALGYTSTTTQSFSLPVAGTMLGFGLLTLAYYPLSQAFQVEQDRAGQIQTIATATGIIGVRWVFTLFFPIAFLILMYSASHTTPAWLLALVVTGGLAIYHMTRSRMQHWNNKDIPYVEVMKLKYLGGLCASGYAIALLCL